MDIEQTYKDYRQSGQSLSSYAQAQGISKGDLSVMVRAFEAGMAAGMRNQGTNKKEELQPALTLQTLH